MATALSGPLALCCAPTRVDDGLPECCRLAKPGQQCPMHHKDHHDSKKPADTAACRMCGTSTPSDLALLSLSGVTGLVPRTTPTTVAFVPTAVVSSTSSTILVRSDRPESPPPRA